MGSHGRSTVLLHDKQMVFDIITSSQYTVLFTNSTLNKITQFWLVESSTVNPK